jgi:fructoselysine 3-epimerase
MAPAAELTITGSNFGYQNHPLEACLDDLAELGLHDIELWAVAPHLDIAAATAGQVRSLARSLTQRGLSVRCLTPEQLAVPVNIASREDWLRTSSVAMFAKAARIAVDLGCETLFLTSGRGYEGEPEQEMWERSADSLRTIVSVAQNLGVASVLEALQPVESNIVTDSAGIARMRELVGSDNLHTVLDTVAMTVAGESVAGFVANAGLPRHVHLVDGNPAGHLAWGDGTIDLAGIVRELATGGYKGYATFELFGNGRYSREPQRALERCLASFGAALAEGTGAQPAAANATDRP